MENHPVMDAVTQTRDENQNVWSPGGFADFNSDGGEAFVVWTRFDRDRKKKRCEVVTQAWTRQLA